MSELKIPIVDYSGQNSTVWLPVASTILDTEITAFFTAVDGMTVGNLGQATLDEATPKDSGPGGTAANAKAQIELKWLAMYHDAVVVTNEHTMEVPCADAGLLSAGTENMDLGAGAGATLKTQFDLFVVSPLTGNAVVLDEVVLVGRNL